MFWCHSMDGVIKAAKERGVLTFAPLAPFTDTTVITLMRDDVEDADADTC